MLEKCVKKVQKEPKLTFEMNLKKIRKEQMELEKLELQKIRVYDVLLSFTDHWQFPSWDEISLEEENEVIRSVRSMRSITRNPRASVPRYDPLTPMTLDEVTGAPPPGPVVTPTPQLMGSIFLPSSAALGPDFVSQDVPVFSDALESAHVASASGSLNPLPGSPVTPTPQSKGPIFSPGFAALGSSSAFQDVAVLSGVLGSARVVLASASPAPASADSASAALVPSDHISVSSFVSSSASSLTHDRASPNPGPDLGFGSTVPPDSGSFSPIFHSFSGAAPNPPSSSPQSRAEVAQDPLPCSTLYFALDTRRAPAVPRGPANPCLSCVRVLVNGFAVNCLRKSSTHACNRCAGMKQCCKPVKSPRFRINIVRYRNPSCAPHVF